MLNRRVNLVLAAGVVALAISGLSYRVDSAIAPEKLPTQLTDREFWRLVSDFSEPDGTFHSENLVSNEVRFQTIVPDLVQATAPGRAYVGVGSEQNFTYIAAVRPAIAFIVDIRRGNLDLHLAYKALFELSADRVEFVSRLFSRERPADLGTTSTAAEIFGAYQAAPPSERLYEDNLSAIYAHLTGKHGFALSTGDRQGVEFVYRSWFTGGPDIRYVLNTGFGGGRGGPGGFPTYADLMTASDGMGRNRSYLATEDSFTFIKNLHTSNMIIPVVGNFGGPTALRAVAKYLKTSGTLVGAFYVSNVEQYLQRDGIWGAFCANAATMPIDRTSLFVRSERGGFGGQRVGGPGFALELSPVAGDVTSCGAR